MFTKALDIDGPVGRLEAVLMMPAAPPGAAAVLCHAHPLHGGVMHYKVLFRVAKVFQEKGYGREERAIDTLECDFPGRTPGLSLL